LKPVHSLFPSIGATMLALLAATSPAWGADRGKDIFLKKGCGECHTIEGPEVRLPVTERHKLKGPTLWYAGSKFQPGYLGRWLVKPQAFRGVKWGTMDKGKAPHPALPPAEAQEVARFLEGLARAAGLTLHVRLIEGEDTGHVVEAIFKALGVALARAAANPRIP